MNTTTLLGDKPVNRIGFGAMQLAGPGVFGPPRDLGAVRAMLGASSSSRAGVSNLARCMSIAEIR
jgi:hypothetical protein